MSLKHRFIWLLAQAGFWAGRWVGRREARSAEVNHRLMHQWYMHR